MMDEDYAGRSLFFVRRLLRCPPMWGTARQAAADLPLNTDTSPEFGSVLFYDSPQWGHTGIDVGNNRAITVDLNGEPVLLPVLGDPDHYWGGPFLGWISARNFAIHSGRKEADDG